MGTNRLESFSDGVMAVAITLLVLGITVPNPNAHPHRSLLYELGTHWPDYAAYAVSFVTIGIIWINHHAMIGRLRVADHAILGLNLLLLMSIAILPFATSLMAAYLKESRGQHLAAGVYAGAFTVMAVFFALLQRHILLRKAHMLTSDLPESRRKQILRRSIRGVGPYVVATVVAILSAYASLAICAAIAVYYALPVASGGAASGSDF
jgi:uncharacterized membrane protein